MKTFKIFATCSLCLSLLAGCDLTDLNENPNEPDNTVDYNFSDPLLASTLRSGIAMDGDDEQRIKSLMIDFYAQIGDAGEFDTRTYGMTEDWNQRQFRRVQSNVSNLNRVIRNLREQGEDKYKHTIAIAKIWRVFVQASGVDFFGPIPFAGYEEVVDNPPYVSVEDNYKEFFRELEEAVAMLDQTSQEPIFMDDASDILFSGDIAKWRKFANSLRLRYALRLSEADGNLCASEAKKAIDAGVMESAADNARIAPKADGTWGANYNYTMFQITWGGAIAMTSTFEKLVTGIGGIDFPTGIVNKRAAMQGKTVALTNVHPEKVDPRATEMFDPGYKEGNWKGLTIGLPATQYNTGEYEKTLYAEFGYIVKNGAPYTTRPYDMFLYEEVCFLKAEAAQRGFVSGLDAKTEYEKGVRVSFETWGVGNQADTYLASTAKNDAGTSAKYDDQSGDGNTALEKIITQKYLAAFPDVAMESWNDKRRLNLPRFDVLVYRYELFYDAGNRNIKDPKNFIKRVQYPQQEAQINQTEYDKGVQLLGGADNITTPLWWDKNKNYCTSAK